MGLLSKRDKWPEEMSMRVENLFTIKGRGTVMCGLLEGEGSLWEGDFVILSQGEFPVRVVMETLTKERRRVGPGQVCVLVGPKFDPDGVSGETVRFRRGVDRQSGRGRAVPSRRYRRPPSP